MKIIPSTKGQVIKVCDCHYDKVKSWKWSANRRGRGRIQYAFMRMQMIDGRQKCIQLHRFIMDCPEGMVVDHINGDTTDNQCSNLRICTQAQNALNNHAAKYNSVSGHRGVYWHKAANKWVAEVVYDHKKYYLGLFKNKLDAAEAYNQKAKELHGEFFTVAA